MIGPWELIPREQLTIEDTTDAAMVEHAEGVARLYRMPGNALCELDFGVRLRYGRRPHAPPSVEHFDLAGTLLLPGVGLEPTTLRLTAGGE
jgi:hypothetical protein